MNHTRDVEPQATETDLLSELDKEIAHQNKWRVIMSLSHSSLSLLAIIASGAATVVAALGYATQAAILAAIATVAFGAEKVLMLREKWVHHLVTVAQLKALRLALRFGDLDTKTAAKKMGLQLENYALGLPIAERAEANEKITE